MIIKLRHELKELLPHLAEMSGNATKLCLFLHLNDREMGVDDDLARGCGWSLSTLKRAIRELKAKEHISQVKSDPTADSAEVKSDNAQIRRVKSDPAPEVKSDPAKVHAVHAGVKSDLQSVPDVPPGATDSTPKALEIPDKYLAGELSDLARKTLAYISFDVDPGSLTKGFVVALEKFGRRQPPPSPGRLCTQIIDACLLTQRKRAARGEDPAFFRWPPGFQKHRDRLRVAERAAGRQERERARAAA